jgi:hypothetical protein
LQFGHSCLSGCNLPFKTSFVWALTFSSICVIMIPPKLLGIQMFASMHILAFEFLFF